MTKVSPRFPQDQNASTGTIVGYESDQRIVGIGGTLCLLSHENFLL